MKWNPVKPASSTNHIAETNHAGRADARAS